MRRPYEPTPDDDHASDHRAAPSPSDYDTADHRTVPSSSCATHDDRGAADHRAAPDDYVSLGEREVIRLPCLFRRASRFTMSRDSAVTAAG